MVGSSLSLLSTESPEPSAEVQSLLSFFASSALRGDWHVTEVGWSDDPRHSPATQQGREHTGVSGGEPDQLAWEAPGESLKRWAQLAAEVETSPDENKEKELVLLTVGWLFRTAVGGRLPQRMAKWLATTLQNQLQGAFLLVFSRQERGQPRRKRGKEAETQVRPGSHPIAAACEFYQLTKRGYIICNAVHIISKEYGVHRKTVYGWIERAEAGKIMPFGAIITATGRCPDPTNVSSRTEAAIVELRHCAASTERIWRVRIPLSTTRSGRTLGCKQSDAFDSDIPEHRRRDVWADDQVLPRSV